MAAVELAEEKRRRTKRAESRIPTFATVEEAADFWDTHSTTEFEDEFEEAPDVQFVVTRGPSTKTLSVRLPQPTMEALAQQASKQGVSPSALARTWIFERLRRGA